MIKPFNVNVPQETLDYITKRVTEYPWDYMPDDGGWLYGTNMDYLKEFCEYWATEYDWRKTEEKLNKFNHFTAEVDGIDMHFIHEKGSGDSPKTLMINHGWPGSVIEFLDIIEPLAHPERFGGKVEDAFDVVAPSLPGFGFSGRPSRPMGPRKMADILNSLMTDVLGYDEYIAQGGDWGSVVTNWIGYDHSDSCKAIHVNCAGMRHVDGPQTPEEIEWQEKLNRDQIMEDGYRTQMATKPQTLSYAMSDSPVGQAAWILEKFHTWSDFEGEDIGKAYSKDTLLSNIMVYIITKTFNSASWVYFGRREEGEGLLGPDGARGLEGCGRVLGADGRKVEVPTACALFPAEMLAWPPRTYCERMYNVTQWSEMDHGGHFAALENGNALVEDIRKFVRTL